MLKLRNALVRVIALALVGCSASISEGQTNPAAQSLPYTQAFGAANFTTMPAGTAAWAGLNGGSITTQALAEASAPTGNASLISGPAGTTGGIYGDGNAGNARVIVVTSSNASNGVNQVVLALNTNGQSNITLAYTLTNVVANARTVGAVAQYRVGTTGSWITLPSVAGNPYTQSGGTVGATTNVSIALPAAAENQPVVQVRWAVWRGTQAGSSSAFAIDNINVTAGGVVAGPTITSQPASQVVTAPTGTSFSVSATGAGTLTYAWRKNGTPLANAGNISGATTQTLTLSSTALGDSGNYDVIVTDSNGQTFSDVATLTVNTSSGGGMGDAGGSQYDPPANYYATTIGTSFSSISSRISSPYVTQSYAAATSSLQVLDRDPANANNVLLAYTRQSIAAPWTGGSTWNREHMWPQSRGTGSSPEQGDLHHLRASNPGVNGARGNKAFGEPNNATFWDADQNATAYYRGQAARACFYMATRFTQLSLVNGDPADNGTQMGDRAALLNWHFQQPPDAFERRRNQLIFTSYHQNRNAYIDNPEWVWAIFGTGPNDSRLYVGATNPPTGTSTLNVNLGDAIVGTAFPTQSVAINKVGTAPTYFRVTPTGSATSTIISKFNAFTGGASSRSTTVGLTSPASATPQNVSGSVVVDNLDLTSSGAGNGSADGDDTISVSGRWLARSNASFTPSTDTNTLTLSFGSVAQSSSTVSLPFSINNLEPTAGLTAGLISTSAQLAGNSAFTLSLGATGDATPIIAGQSRTYQAVLTPPATTGAISATYTIAVADAPIPGAGAGTNLVLTLNATIVASGPTPCNPADIGDNGSNPGPDGCVDNGDFSLFISQFFNSSVQAGCATLTPGIACAASDIADNGSNPGPDGLLDNGDFSLFISSFFNANCTATCNP
jgi:endonuclease I